jgi:MSHA biogenesis protein MshO
MQLNRKLQSGFTLIEMIVVMVITGILGGMIAIFISGPVQGYVDSARRAEISDIADTAMSRIKRDLRTALPNSVRITMVGSAYYMEFIPTTGGGRYRSNAAGGTGSCGGAGDALSIGIADTCFEVLGPMPTFATGNSVVVYNLGNAGNSAYNATDSTPWVSSTPPAVFFTSFIFPSASPGDRFQVISTPVSYVCNPAAGTLTRYAGYPIAATQPTTTLAGGDLLASNVSACTFANPLAGLVTVYLTISESGESISLYDTANVANVP